MFKKLGEVIEGRVLLLTIRTTEAWLEGPNLYIVVNEEMEALTTSKEREVHFETASNWLKEQLKKWEEKKESKVEVATVKHPLEVVTGDVAPILVIEGKRYLISVYRDIPPEGWLMPGGCPRTREELFNPKPLAIREGAEEILISDKEGRVYNLFPSTTGMEENIQALELEPKEIISLPVTELLPSEIELPPSASHAQNLIMRFNGQERQTKDVSVTVDDSCASVAITRYFEITLPFNLSELKLFDGEKFPNGTLINRPVRLTDEGGREVAIFSRGQNILAAGWISKAETKRAVIPEIRRR